MCAGDGAGDGGAKREACVRTPVSRLFSYRARPAPVSPASGSGAGPGEERQLAVEERGDLEERQEQEEEEEEAEEVVVVVEPQVSQVPEVIVEQEEESKEKDKADDGEEKESEGQQQQRATPSQPQPQKSETETATTSCSPSPPPSSSPPPTLLQSQTDEEEEKEEEKEEEEPAEEVEVVSESPQSTAPPTASTPSSSSGSVSPPSPPSPPPSDSTPPTQAATPPPETQAPPQTPPKTPLPLPLPPPPPPPRPPSPLFPAPPPPTAAMVRNIVVLGGSSHPELVATICHQLGIPNGRITLSKFAVGETRVEIQDSVRGKDVFVIQSGCGRVNDGVIELLITISACKTASAKRVTAVLPHFPYSRQSDIPYNKVGAPLTKAPTNYGNGTRSGEYTFESRPGTPGPVDFPIPGVSHGDLEKGLSRLALERGMEAPSGSGTPKSSMTPLLRRSNTAGSVDGLRGSGASSEWSPPKNTGYKQWVAQAGTLVADLLTCAGADHIITMDLHDPQYQGFFDIPVDNLYGRPLLQRYIKYNIPDYQNAVIVSPDAGGAKRATAIADALGMEFALIHKERRPTRITDRQNATMMLVGDIAGKVAILVDDMADTSNTITRAAKLLKGKGGATKVYALVTHGVFSGDAIERINASALDRVVTTNTVPQDENRRRCHKLEVLDVGEVFAEAVRRVHHGESISVLFRNE